MKTLSGCCHNSHHENPYRGCFAGYPGLSDYWPDEGSLLRRLANPLGLNSAQLHYT